MNPSLCIVGGCGHIGLPLGIAFALGGVRVDLLDTDEARTRTVASGSMPFRDVGADEALRAALAGGLLRAHHSAGSPVPRRQRPGRHHHRHGGFS